MALNIWPFNRRRSSRIELRRAGSFPSSGEKKGAKRRHISSTYLGQGSAFSAAFYSYIRTRVPVVSNGIAAWVDLSATRQRVEYHGGSERQQGKAQEIIAALDQRVYEYDFERQAGMDKLMSAFFISYFTNGRFCAELIPYADGSGVAYVSVVNPFTVSFARRGEGVVLVQERQDGTKVDLPRDRMFYSAFDPDAEHPGGVSMLDSIGWVLEIKEKLIEDMAKSSHNVGYPRLHVRIDRPEPLPGEKDSDYVARANAEFDGTEEAFRDVGVEENIVSWSDVNVTVVGGAQGSFTWSVNADRVGEEVIVGLHLYAWVLGLSYGTTKNWVDSQFDLLMTRVLRAQRSGKRFAEWIRNVELAMRGSPVRCEHHFETVRDPGELIKQRALSFRWKRVDEMVQRGVIGPEQGARELGYQGAYNAGRFGG